MLKVPGRISFKAFFRCSQGGDHPENNLAKFGFVYIYIYIYIYIILYSWLPAGTYHKKSGDFEFFFL